MNRIDKKPYRKYTDNNMNTTNTVEFQGQEYQQIPKDWRVEEGDIFDDSGVLCYSQSWMDGCCKKQSPSYNYYRLVSKMPNCTIEKKSVPNKVVISTGGNPHLNFAVLNKAKELLGNEPGFGWMHPHNVKLLSSYTVFIDNGPNQRLFVFVEFDTHNVSWWDKTEPPHFTPMTIEEFMKLEKADITSKFTVKDLVAGAKFKDADGRTVYLVGDDKNWRLGGFTGNPFELFLEPARTNEEMLEVMNNEEWEALRSL